MKVQTQLHVGACVGETFQGTVIQITGNGYYAAVRGADGQKRFVNKAYTSFYPNDQPLYVGEAVMFNLHPAGYPNAGKISCIAPAMEPGFNPTDANS